MSRSASLVLLLAAALATSATPVHAQSAILTLPDISQGARVTQRIGLTDISVAYHRPSVAGRKVFGGLEAYGHVWRAGANLNTVIELTDPVTVEGHALARGVYGLHMIPGETSWVVIFSKNATSWGSFSYDSTEDALRVTVRPQTTPLTEVLSYTFDEPTDHSVQLTMRWEHVAVPVRIDVDVPHLVAASLRNQLRGRIQTEWPAWEEAANYLLANSLDAAEALRFADQSVAIDDRFENEITRARALTALGRASEARAAQAKAVSLGTQAQVYAFGRGLQRLGQQAVALELYRTDSRRSPGTWIAHQELARLAVAAGDFGGATRELQAAHAIAPADARESIEQMLAQVGARVDINR